VRSRAHERATGLIRAAVTAICGSAVLRRHLRYEPERGLRDLEVSGPPPLGPLPAPTLGLSPDLNDTALLGPPTALSGALVLPLELRLVLYGLRPTALVAAPASSLAEILSAARAHGMIALVGPEEFRPEADPRIGGFADRASQVRPLRIEKSEAPTWWQRAVVGTSADVVALAWLAQLFHWNAYLGVLLGYPACCTIAFAQNWSEAHRRYRGDLGAFVLAKAYPRRRVITVPWETNVFARYFGDTLLAHFPCGLECAESIAGADRMLVALTWHEGDLARDLRARLGAPVLVTQDEGLFRFIGARGRLTRRGWALEFDDVHATDARAHTLRAALLSAGRVTLVARESAPLLEGRRRPLPGRLLLFDQEVAHALRLAS
jgi:hypothetical protein